MKSTGSNNSNSSGSIKVERKTIEKNRRIHMKSLCLQLSSLVPQERISNCSKDVMTQLDNLGEAASYIMNLKQRIEKLKEKRDMEASSKGMINREIRHGVKINIKLPVIEVRQQEPYLEIILISGLYKRFRFHKVIGILEEEGAEVINASLSVLADKVFYTLHCQARSSRVGLEGSRVAERLKESLIEFDT